MSQTCWQHNNPFEAVFNRYGMVTNYRNISYQAGALEKCYVVVIDNDGADIFIL
jgi:hypothetical protein